MPIAKRVVLVCCPSASADTHAHTQTYTHTHSNRMKNQTHSTQYSAQYRRNTAGAAAAAEVPNPPTHRRQQQTHTNTNVRSASYFAVEPRPDQTKREPGSARQQHNSELLRSFVVVRVFVCVFVCECVELNIFRDRIRRKRNTITAAATNTNKSLCCT